MAELAGNNLGFTFGAQGLKFNLIAYNDNY